MIDTITVENLIEQVRDLIRFKGEVHPDTPIYDKFHKEVADFVFENFLDKTEHWELIHKNLIWQSNHYLSIQEANNILTGLENLRLEMLERKNASKDPFWQYIHPLIIEVAQKLFIDKHYHKSVLTAFIQIEVRLKHLWTKYNPKEDKPKEDKSKEDKPKEDNHSASRLMEKVFSNNEPIFLKLQNGDNDGNGVQVGFMKIFSGAMTGIRNIPAHGNMEICKEDAVRKLMLASLLMYKVDDAVSFSDKTE